ncbi:FAD-dependent oxidoreductase [Arcanobacterium phocae]|uniref:FAD-dependent oxidoreductase n=1 Tax=Arcanobacterium phocae TaxID=131112 RepID=UPI00209C8540|nr:FAD-dependent oxidoreductase [Arcanobacterium phocae]
MMEPFQYRISEVKEDLAMNVDVLVIGWGKAGKTLAGKLAEQGKSVALVEKSASMYGGTCINIGCVPTKTLITSAHDRREADSPAEYFEKSVAHRDEFIARLRAANHAMLEGRVTLIDGRAQFVDSHRVKVVPTVGEAEELEISAGTIIINTGTVPAHPPIPGIDLPGVYDSTTIQHVQPLPRKLVIVGGSFIGLEFATMMNDFGSDVTVIDPAGKLLPRLDDDVAASVKQTMEDQGIHFVLSQAVSEISKSENGLTVHTDKGQFDADAVLVAVGRASTAGDLDLVKAGIEIDKRGFIRVDEKLRTSVPGVYAVGDINGGPQFTYISYDDHRIVLDDLLGSSKRSTKDRVAVPWTAFLNPPLSGVGLTQEQAVAEGRDVRIAQADIAKIAVMPRPKIIGNSAGSVKFVIDAQTDKILGASLHCIDSQELINMVALAIRVGATASQLRDGIWTHPSSTEMFNGVL